jgi:hypothetical protein
MTSTALPGAERSAEGGHSWLERFLDGDHAWGTLSVSLADRSGSIRYHLTVFPPGISPDQRRALVFCRRWAAAGLLVALFVAIVASTLVNGWLALGLGAAIYVGAFVVANVCAGEARRDVVEVRAALVNLVGKAEAFGDFEVLEDAVARFHELDELAAESELSPVEYELGWGEIYRCIVEEISARGAASSQS